MTETNHETPSPYWGSTTKLVIGLTLVTIIGALLVRFQNIIGPLILTFMLTYLIHPVASFIVDRTKLSWRGAVNLIFLALLVAIISFTTATGVAVVNQLQSLVRVVQNFISDLPELAQSITTQVYVIPVINYTLDVGQIISQLNIDLLALSQEVLGLIQPMLGQAGSLLGTLATSALSAIGWGAFIFVIAYFILADAGRTPGFFNKIDFPGHLYDIQRLGRELNRIWNAFLRGQLLLFVLIILTSFLLMTILGVRNAMGLALLAGLAKFVPYIGPLIAGLVTALVAFFQDSNYLDIEPLTYALIVVVAAVVLDQIFDNIITPRIFGSTLGVHPAAVLVSAIIAASLIGLIGLLLAAPVLASIQLFGRYTMRKMLDLEPWPEPEPGPAEIYWPFEKQIRSLWERFKTNRAKGKQQHDE